MKKNNIIIFSTDDNSGAEKASFVRTLLDSVIFCVCALIIGIITGGADAVFGIVLLKITDIRDSAPYYFIPFLAFAGLIIYFIYDRFGKEVSQGMSLIFERAQDTAKIIKLRLIPFVTVSTWLTHLFGGSAGREGVAVQIGGTLGSYVAEKIKIKNKNTAKILTVTGMAAGFGGLFQTPIAAVFFATEVLCAGKLEMSAFLPALIAAYSACYVSSYLGLGKFTVEFDIEFHITTETLIPFCIAAILFGLIGGGFALAQKYAKKYSKKLITNPYLRIAVGGAAVSVFSLLLYNGRYSGLGTNIISASFNNEEIYYWDFILKLVFTIVTLSVGFQGGEVTPLFAIGASFGVIIAEMTGMPVLLFAALGYCAVFGAATNTLLAPIFIGAEVFGYKYIPFFFAACTIAYMFNGNNSIYSLQKREKDQLKIISFSK